MYSCFLLGSVTRVKKVVSTTTHVMENDEPVVEVTISPMEMRESLQRNTRTTTTTTTSRTSNRSEHETSADFSDVRSPRSPNGYLVEESTRRVKTTAGEVFSQIRCTFMYFYGSVMLHCSSI